MTPAADAVAPARHRLGSTAPVRAVLLDRDGTIVVDVPYNGDPERVRPVPGARAALDRLRDAGLALGVVSNQSGIGRGRLTRGQVTAVNARAEELLGPFGTWQVCPHAPEDGCPCRKPAPGLVLAAAAALGVAPAECVVVGDIGADVGAAVAAGARAVLVPTPVTRPEEVATAARMPGVVVVTDLAAAAEHVLDLVGDPAAVDAGHGTPGDPDHPTALAARPEAAR
ncbi:HAD-IIIA family hydrolase [Georgenia sp. TF02-10]|uniref:HAD-IIIA family hydrolase n=1 Tax=Georgenia sp. TF02-10 TaxID=2917725 RepID=UPI001FA7F0DA|nr:HAD-IIIA family hydrolase [Georgenia sp. TF02-10]UNX54783.1 HAD-IIIA family hydrolase [Georgenia sp. TF02-10]